MKFNIDSTVKVLKDEEMKNISKRKFKDKDIKISRTPIQKNKKRGRNR